MPPPSLSVLVITRNAPQSAARCLESLLACEATLAAGNRQLQFILIDDCSFEETDPSKQFAAFRNKASAAAPVIALRFRSRLHYAAAMAYGMSLAPAGGDVLFISHDMMLTPACALELFDLCESQPDFGVLRPRSAHMDFATKMELAPSSPIQTVDEASRFAEEVRRQFAGQVTGWPALIGDALYIRAAVIERIGVFDTRFYGFWSDLDYGVRVQRAGWRHGIAAGAWLHHSGSASGLENFAAGEVAQKNHEEMLRDSHAAYEIFRRKWGEELLPSRMEEMDAAHYRALRSAAAPSGGEYQPPVQIPDGIAQTL